MDLGFEKRASVFFRYKGKSTSLTEIEKSRIKTLFINIKMNIASDKWAQSFFKSKSDRNIFNDQPLRTLTTMRDLDIPGVALIWSSCNKMFLSKANDMLYCLRRNVAYSVKTVVKRGP